MTRSLIILALAAVAFAPACKSTECAKGTIDRNGECQPADETTGDAKCGPFTQLIGDQCIPMFPPTVCDPATTAPDVDQTTGVVTCIGTGGGGCSAPLACPQPSDGTHSTLCGQLYDLEDNTKFAATGASGTRCTTPTADGPCSVALVALDALALGMGGSLATAGLAVSDTYVDDCGRFKLTGVPLPTSGIYGLAADDIDQTNGMGPFGVINVSGIAFYAMGGGTSKDLEMFIVKPSTTTSWAVTSGGAQDISHGFYVPIFRKHVEGMGDQQELASGVSFGNLDGTSPPTQSHYFVASETARTNVDPAATMTGVNGTVLVDSATVAGSNPFRYTGNGAITDPVNCMWDVKPGATVPYIVFVQIFRPVNLLTPGHTCTQ